MNKGILLAEAEEIVKEHGLKTITLLKQKDILIPSQQILSKIQKDGEASNNNLVKYVVLMGGGTRRFFTHAEPIVVQKKDDHYHVFCLGTDFFKYIAEDQSSGMNITFITPVNKLKDKKVSIFGNGVGCLELAIYSLEKLDLEKGIILNGEKGHAITELKNGDAYSTEELAKLTRSEKYLQANGIDPKNLSVTNSEAQAVKLSEYRQVYQIGAYNNLLTILSDAPKRAPVKRQNSLEDLRKLMHDQSQESAKKVLEQLIEKREGARMRI